MIIQLTIFFWTVILIGSIIGYRYYKSRNKRLFFSKGSHRAFLWSLLIIVGGGLVLIFLLPAEPLDFSWAVMHSEAITSGLEDTQGVNTYGYRILAIITEMNLLGLLSAGLIATIWLYYVRALDFFNQEKTLYSIICLLGGMLTTSLVFPVSDLVNSLLDISYSSSTLYNIFVYCFMGIGMVRNL